MDERDGLDGFENRVREIETALGGADAIAANFNREMTKLQTTMSQTNQGVQSLEKGLSRGLKQAIDGLVFGGDSISDALKGIGQSVLNSAYSSAITPLTKQLGEGLSSSISSGLGSLIGGLLPFEKGGAFSQGQVMPFANGGVVSSPTYFPMRGGNTGLMGEAGPEAIMPLSRDANGKLGVRAEGGGKSVNITMNISTPDVEGFRRSRSQLAAQVSRSLGRGQRNQ